MYTSASLVSGRCVKEGVVAVVTALTSLLNHTNTRVSMFHGSLGLYMEVDVWLKNQACTGTVISKAIGKHCTH